MLLRGVYTQAQEPHNGTSGEYTTEFPSLPPPRRHLSFDDDTQRSTPVMRDGEVGAARSGPRLNSSCPSSGGRGRGRGRVSVSISGTPDVSVPSVGGGGSRASGGSVPLRGFGRGSASHDRHTRAAASPLNDEQSTVHRLRSGRHINSTAGGTKSKTYYSGQQKQGRIDDMMRDKTQQKQ